jgi:hypothetical protein
MRPDLIDATECQFVSHLRQSEALPHDRPTAFETRITKAEYEINPPRALCADRDHRRAQALIRPRGGVRVSPLACPYRSRDVSNAAGGALDTGLSAFG